MLNPEKLKVCERCDEPVLAGESTSLVGGKAFHAECYMRMAIGPLAHVLRRCSCYVPGSTEHDPEGMTQREAARAAVEAWRLLNWDHRDQMGDAQQDDRDP